MSWTLSVVACAFRVFALTAQEEPTAPPPAGAPSSEEKKEEKAEKKEEKKEEKAEEKAEKREGKEEEKKEGKEGEKGEGKEHEEGEGEEEEGENGPKWSANIDFVLGFGTTPVVVPNEAPAVAGAPTNLVESTRIRTQSFMLGLAREVGRFEFGARIPFMVGTIADRATVGALENRDRAVFGNLELEAVYAVVENKKWNFDAGLELALPTGGGSEQPTATELAKEPDKKWEYRSIDRGAIMKVSEWSRGSYESALFEPDRLGLIPRLAAKFKLGPVTIRPAVKFETLIDTTGEAPESIIGEFVGSIRASVTLAKIIEPGAMVWTNITVTKHEERDLDILEVYPYLRVKVGSITPEIGAYIPLVGHLAFSDEAKAWGLKFAVNARF